MLLIVLVVPHLAVRTRDELVDVRVVLGPDVPEPLLVGLREVVAVSEHPEVGYVLHVRLGPLPHEALPEPLMRCIVLPHCMHAFTLERESPL